MHTRQHLWARRPLSFRVLYHLAPHLALAGSGKGGVEALLPQREGGDGAALQKAGAHTTPRHSMLWGAGRLQSEKRQRTRRNPPANPAQSTGSTLDKCWLGASRRLRTLRTGEGSAHPPEI